ncbi:unnamed protein product [Leuciscus chuanchicus]
MKVLEEVFVRNHLSNFESPPELFSPQRDHWKKGHGGRCLYCKTQSKGPGNVQAGVNGKSGPVLPVEQWSLLVVPPPLALPSTSPSGPIICADLPGSCPHPPPLPPTPTLPSLTLPDRLLLLSVAKLWPDHRVHWQEKYHSTDVISKHNIAHLLMGDRGAPLPAISPLQRLTNESSAQRTARSLHNQTMTIKTGRHQTSRAQLKRCTSLLFCPKSRTCRLATSDKPTLGSIYSSRVFTGVIRPMAAGGIGENSSKKSPGSGLGWRATATSLRKLRN